MSVRKGTYLFPMQPLGPSEKGCNASLSSSWYFAADSLSSHRSGSHVSGDAKFLLLRYVDHWWTPTEIYISGQISIQHLLTKNDKKSEQTVLTPPGTYLPSTTAPSRPVTRGSVDGTGG